jgi:hypothetical protein
MGRVGSVPPPEEQQGDAAAAGHQEGLVVDQAVPAGSAHTASEGAGEWFECFCGSAIGDAPAAPVPAVPCMVRVQHACKEVSCLHYASRDELCGGRTASEGAGTYSFSSSMIGDAPAAPFPAVTYMVRVQHASRKI